jgi:hypothetical protein
MFKISQVLFGRLVFFSTCFLTLGCTHSELVDAPAPGARHRLLLPPTPSANNQTGHRRQAQAARQTTNQASNSPAINITGHWRVGFQANQEKLSSSLEITQSSGGFQGKGVDDQTGNTFKIEDGRVEGNQISFLKKYDNPSNPAVRYTGQFSILHDTGYEGPYMAGQYAANVNGGVLSGEWEAAMLKSGDAISKPINSADNNTTKANEASGQSTQQPPVPNPANANHAPDLSGKWEVGYEYNFKTIHSIMYLEQDGGKLLGHGIDSSTNEKFVIAKGWYNFPHVTILRRYPKSKRELIFKADVSNLNESDYQGPYLSGKTQGGGNWEGQLVK